MKSTREQHIWLYFGVSNARSQLPVAQSKSDLIASYIMQKLHPFCGMFLPQLFFNFTGAHARRELLSFWATQHSASFSVVVLEKSP